jgi:CheY-like chemotaxis protein
MSRVLVIDDDQDIADVTARILKAGGHEVDIELDDAKALERIAGERPDLVVLDVMFPGNNNAGFELARAISQKFAGMPIIMVTSVNEHSKLGFSNKDRDAAWLPVSEFVEKPIKKERLLALVEKLAGTKKA